MNSQFYITLEKVFAQKIFKKGIFGIFYYYFKTLFMYVMVAQFKLSDFFSLMVGLKINHFMTKKNFFLTYRDSDSLEVIFEIVNQNNYERHFSLEEHDLVVDIGGHSGVFSLYGSTKTSNEIYIFEPDPDNFSIIKENLALNGKNKIYPYNLAVVGKNGKMVLNRSNKSGRNFVSNGKNKTNRETNEESIEVNSLTLKDIFINNKIEKIGFLKMDCEGAEYEIFENTPRDFINRINKISIEYHEFNEHMSGQKLANFLMEHNFKVWLEQSSSSQTGYIYALNKSLLSS